VLTDLAVVLRKRDSHRSGGLIVAGVVLCCLATPASAFAGIPTGPSSHVIDETRLFLLGAFVVLGVLSVFVADVTVGVDKRLSTSKTIAAVWTYLVASALLGFVVAKFAGYPLALEKMVHSGLAGQYGLLIGGPLGAAIAAKGIVSSQVSKKASAKTSSSGSPTPTQLVQNDVGETDLGDFQYVLFNIVAMVFFVGSIIQSPAHGFPRIPDILLGLTSVAAAGYVTKKALPPTAPTAKLAPSEGAAGTAVTITGTNLLTAELPRDTQVAVLFGNISVEVQEADRRADGFDQMTVKAPAGLAAGSSVFVTVIVPPPTGSTDGPVSVAAGQFKPT
jgi:hypothetical protein